MPRTNPHRRVVHATDVVEDAITKAELAKPETNLPSDVLELDYEQRLQRQIDMLNIAMTKYERVLQRGGELDSDSEKKLMLLIDSARKLELAMAQIRAKSDGEGGQTDLELALFLYDKGIPIDAVKANFRHNPNLADQLDGAISDRD